MAVFDLGKGSEGSQDMKLIGDLLNLGSGLFSGGGSDTSTIQHGSSTTDSSQKGKGQSIGLAQLLEQLLQVSQTESTENVNKNTNTTSNTTNSTDSQTQGGSNSSTNQNTTGNTNTSQNTNSATATEGTVTKGTGQSNDALTALITQLQGNIVGAGAGYSKADAIADSQGSVDAMINQILNSGIGSVFEADNSSGAYDSTTQAGLANDLAAKAAASGAAVRQQAIGDYASIEITKQDQAAKNLLSAIQQAAEGTITTKQNATETGTLAQQVAATESSNTNTSETNFENTLAKQLGSANTSTTEAQTTDSSTTNRQESLRESTQQQEQIELQEQQGTQQTNTSNTASARKDEDGFFDAFKGVF